MKQINRKKYQGFTLIEMLIVLLVISVLVLLFVPNLLNQRENINKKGDAAFTEVIQTQIELYRLDKNETPTVKQLLDGKYLNQKQIDRAIELKLLSASGP